MSQARLRGTLCAALAAVAILIAAVSRPDSLPYDHSNPVIYDNDGAIESGFTDVYMMALASAGVIKLRGIVSTCSCGEEQRKPPFSPLPVAEIVQERQELIAKARRSGLRNLPDATAGCSLSLKRPVSGRIEDTAPHGSPAARLIVREAHKASAARPLVIVMGGQATSVVDAYLLDNSIADKMVLAWIVGNRTAEGGIDCREYNAGVDPWATYIAFERLRVVAFPFTNDGDDTNDGGAATPKARLGELPDTELRQTMMAARWPRGPGVFSEPRYDTDAMPAIALTRPDFAQQTKRFSFDHWETAVWGPEPRPQVPSFKEAAPGRALVVWSASGPVATEEWWRRVKDPAAWGPAQGQIPYGGKPWQVPGSIEAESFDEGGEGRAYHDTTINLTKEEWFNPIRLLEDVDILRSATASGGYMVGRTEPGEWIKYTVKVTHRGAYKLGVTVASEGPGGTFHLEFGGADKTGPMTVPDTGGWDKWQTVSRPAVLEAGVQTMRLVMDSAGASKAVGDFDCVRLDPPVGAESTGR